MKNHPYPNIFRKVTSAIGELVISSMENALQVSRSNKKLIHDGDRWFESYLITGTDKHDVGLVGIIGVGMKRATFFCDKPRTAVQKEIILAALNCCMEAAL